MACATSRSHFERRQPHPSIIYIHSAVVQIARLHSPARRDSPGFTTVEVPPAPYDVYTSHKPRSYAVSLLRYHGRSKTDSAGTASFELSEKRPACMQQDFLRMRSVYMACNLSPELCYIRHAIHLPNTNLWRERSKQRLLRLHIAARHSARSAPWV